ncbi:MAG TPA: hypothetical protein VFN61_12965 [Acidimicrobiales bacterium]|nr:hypothetical protein [Acidimicrobiales bacterium]
MSRSRESARPHSRRSYAPRRYRKARVALVLVALGVLAGLQDPALLVGLAILLVVWAGLLAAAMHTPKEQRVPPLVMTVDDTQVVFKRGKVVDRVERPQVALAVICQGRSAVVGIELYDDERRSLGYWSIDRFLSAGHWYMRAFGRHGWPWMVDRPVLYFIPGRGLSHDAPPWAKDLRSRRPGRR